MTTAANYIGKPIRSLQTMLRAVAAEHRDIPPVVPDGIFGADTEAAVRAFQRSSALPETGTVDNATWNQLVAVFLALDVFPAEPLRLQLQPGQTISPGARNRNLFLMQGMLLALSTRYQNLPAPAVTGVHDAASVRAVEALQTLAGLPATGTIDRATWRCLSRLHTLAIGDGRW